MLTGYKTTLPTDTLLSAGVLYCRLSDGTIVTLGVTDGAPDFDPGVELGEIMFDNRSPSRLKGLTRRVGFSPVIKGVAKEFGPAVSGGQIARLEPDSSEAAADGNGTKLITPKAAGSLITAGVYITEFRWLFERASGGYACIFAPLAICRKWSKKGSDKKEAQISFEFEAIGDPVNDLGTGPYAIEIRTSPPQSLVPLILTLDWAPLLRRSDLANPLVFTSDTGQTGSQSGTPQHLGAGQLNLGGGQARVEYPKSADAWGFVAPVDAAMAADVVPNVFHATSNVVVDGPYRNTAARSILPSVSADHYAALDMRWQGLSTADNQDLTSFKRSLACALIAQTPGDVGKTVRVNLIDQANDPGGAGWSGSVPVIKFVDVVLRHSLAEIDHTVATASLWEHVALTFDNYAEISALVGPPTLVVTMVPASGTIAGYAVAPYTHHGWQEEETDPSNWLLPVPFHETLGVQSTDIVCNCWNEDSDDPTLYGGAAKAGTAIAAPDSDRYYGGRTLKQFTLGVGDGVTTTSTIRIEDGGDSPPTLSNVPTGSAWFHWYIEPASGHTLPLDTDLAAYLSVTSSVVIDHFTRADSGTSLGSAVTGQAWTALDGTWGISSNQAYLAVGGSSNRAAAVVESGQSDVTVSVKVSTKGTAATRLVLRATDVDNLLMLDISNGTGFTLYRRQAGSYTALASDGVTVVSNGDVFSVTASGSSLTVKQNGSTVLTTTSTFNQTATKHGIGADDVNTVARLDDFSVATGLGVDVTYGPFAMERDSTRYGLTTVPGPLVRANGGQFFRARATFNLADEGYLDFTPKIVSTVPGLVFNAYRVAVTTEGARGLGLHSAWVPKRTVSARQFGDSAFEIIPNIEKIMTPPTLLWVMRQVVPWSFGDLADINGAGADSYIPSLWQSGPYGSADYAFKCDVNQHGDGTFSLTIEVARGFPTADPGDYMSWSVVLQNASIAQAATAWPKFVAFDLAVAALNGVPVVFGLGLGTGTGIQWLNHGDSFLGGTVVFSHGTGLAWTFDAGGIPGPDFGHMGIAADLDRVRQTNGWFQALAAGITVNPATVQDSIAFYLRSLGPRKDYR